MNIKLVSGIISGDYTDVELLNSMGLPAIVTAGATDLTMRLSGKHKFKLKLLGANNITEYGTNSVRGLFRAVLKEVQGRAYNLFKGIDIDTGSNVMILVHTRRIFLIQADYGLVLIRVNEKHVLDGTYSETDDTYHEYSIIRGTMGYAAPVDRFLETYEGMREGLDNFVDLDTIPNTSLFENIQKIYQPEPLMELIIQHTRIEAGKAYRVALIVDSCTWYLTRGNTATRFKYAKLNDLLHLVAEVEVTKPETPLTLKDDVSEMNTADLKYTRTAKLPTGTARKYLSPIVPAECLDHILKTIDKAKTTIGTVGVIREIEKLSRTQSGQYYLAGYGMFGRTMLTSKAQKDLLANLCADSSDIFINANDIKIYYSNVLDVNAIYITSPKPVTYLSSTPEPLNLTADTEETQMPNQATNLVTTNTIANTKTTPVSKVLLDYLKDDLNLKVSESYEETDIRVIPAIFDGAWTIINAGDASNLVPVTECEDSNICNMLNEGAVIITPTRTFIGTDETAFVANTAIRLPKEPEIREVTVEVQLPAPEYTKDELVEKLIEKIKAGECTALELIAKLSAVH